MDTLPTASSTDLSPLPPENRRRTALILGVMAILALGAFVLGSKMSRHPAPSSENTFATLPQSRERPVVVDISGRVKKPGVYELPFNARIFEALEKAGGALPDADLSAINRAAWVEDGSQLYIPPKPSAAAPSPTPAAPVFTPESTFEADPPSLALPAASPSAAPTLPKPTEKPTKAKEVPRGRIDLNRATMEELQQLPGIGPAMAQRILDYRKEIRGFTSVEDLDGVRGIGEKKLEKIRPFVTVKLLPFQQKPKPASETEPAAEAEQ